ncbi:MAG: SRPBCC domain-containing protein [Micromonosporaceae bacterium]|nr:SRPBCC domain-containing protein [Micromonosporaceae bacterium]
MAGDPVVVRQSIFVELPADEAFRLFTDGIGQWWPLDEGFSYGGNRARDIFLEARVGGRFYERFVDGDELQVGTVVSCTPPHTIVFTWRSPDWAAETEVEVTFTPATGGTTVELVHRGFERLGPDGPTMARRWANGWPRVIAAFADGASRSS